MKSKFIYLLVAILALNSCSKDSKSTDVLPTNTCGVTNPVEDIPWLKDRLEDYGKFASKKFYVWQTDYQGKTVFVVSVCDGGGDTLLGVFDCEGNYADDMSGITDYLNSVTSRYIIWKPEGFECNI